MEIAFNKKARFDYAIHDTLEGGLVLTGLEVKAARAKRVQLAGSYARVLGGELYLVNAKFGVGDEHSRKILIHKHELKSLLGKLESGFTLIPLKMYFKAGKIKVLLGLGRGKKQRDKREAIKKRDVARELSRN